MSTVFIWPKILLAQSEQAAFPMMVTSENSSEDSVNTVWWLRKLNGQKPM